MTWVRIDDLAPLHPKLLDAGPEAAWLWLTGLAHCNRCHTDGFIAARHLPALYPGKWTAEQIAALAAQLVAVRLWHVEPDGYRVHDYADFQAEATREAVDIRRQYERDRKAAQRARRKVPEGVPDNVPDKSRDMSHGTTAGHVPGTSVGHDTGTPVGPESGTAPDVSQPPVPSRPVPSQSEQTLSLAPPAPATSTPKAPREKKPAADPPPFALGEAFEAIASESRGRFVAGVERDWTKGVRIAVAKSIRAYPDLALWRRLGRWLAAGGDAFRGSVGPAWAASNALADAMARAAAWEAQGGAPIAARPNGAPPPRPAPAPPPAPPRAPSAPRVTADEVRAFRAALEAKETSP